MENIEYYRPREAALKQGRKRKVRIGLGLCLSLLVLAGFASCFLVPQSKVSSFQVRTRLYGLSNQDVASAQRPLTRDDILQGLGVNGSEYCMFLSESRLKSNLQSAWFVSPSHQTRVELGPFSCDLYFQDVYPLGKTLDGIVYLSSGATYESLTGVPEFAEAYPDPESLPLVTIPTGVVGEYDYGGTDQLQELLVDLAPIDPAILSSGWLSGAVLDRGELYLYIDFPQTSAGSRVRLDPSDLVELSGEEMLPQIQMALVGSEAPDTVHQAEMDPVDSFTGKAWYQLEFALMENGRPAVFWDD